MEQPRRRHPTRLARAGVGGHHPVLPGNSLSAWDAPTLAALLRKFPCAKAYINGHNHAGAHVVREGFHYLTLDGMVDTRDRNAFSVATLYRDRLELTGFGRQESRVLGFRAQGRSQV